MIELKKLFSRLNLVFCVATLLFGSTCFADVHGSDGRVPGAYSNADQSMTISKEELSSLVQRTIHVIDGIKRLKDMPEKKRVAIASKIVIESHRIGVDPRVFVAILKVESNFNGSAVSSTKDISIAQINYRVWGPEFKRMGKQLDPVRLVKDDSYAIKSMADILATLKREHEKMDAWWFARYHSSTPCHYNRYKKELSRIIVQMDPKASQKQRRPRALLKKEGSLASSR